MAHPLYSEGSRTGPVLVADAPPYPLPPPPTKVFVPLNPGTLGAQELSYVFNGLWVASIGGTGLGLVAIWQQLFGQWVLNSTIGNIALPAGEGTLFIGGGGGTTPLIYNVPTFLQLVTPDGATFLAAGMAGNQ